MSNLIEVAKAKPGQLPFTRATIYKFQTLQKYPDLIVKVASKLFFDMDVWEQMVEEARREQIEKANKIRKAAQEAMA